MPRIASFSPLGPLEIEEQLHQGAMFDVYLVRRETEHYCLKTPVAAPGASLEREPVYLSRATGIGTSLWGGDTQAGWQEVMAEPWLSGALLTLEAEKIRQTRGAWNHHVHALGFWDGESEGWRFNDLLSGQRFRSALLMPYHRGTPFGELPSPTQRFTWPRMMASMWKALATLGHGDLSPGNILLAPDLGRFVLIDPGVFLASRSTEKPEDVEDSMDHGLVFTCDARYYPVLPPCYLPPQAMGARATLPHHIRWLSMIGGRGFIGPVMGSAADYAVDEDQERSLLQAALDGEVPPQPAHPDQLEPPPPPADMMALGIITYELLTGQHPLAGYDPALPPLWLGGFGEQSQEVHEAYTRFLQWWEETGPTPPRELNPDLSAAEEKLALTLLGIEVASFVELVALLHDIERGRANR